MSGDLVVHPSSDLEAKLQPYLLAGGSWFFPEGDNQGGVNAGLGLAVHAGPAVGFFIEGRYFRIANYKPQRDDLLLVTAGFRVPL